MAINDFFLLKTPREMMEIIGQRVKALRLQQNLPQTVLAQRAGISVGTVKHFEKTGEIQLRHLLQIALVLNRIGDFEPLFAMSDVPQSLFTPQKTEKVRQRARRSADTL